MEIIAQRISTISLNFVQDVDEGIDEITPFISSLSKIKKCITQIGLNNGFTKNEKELWLEVFRNLISEEAGNPKVQVVPSNAVEVDE